MCMGTHCNGERCRCHCAWCRRPHPFGDGALPEEWTIYINEDDLDVLGVLCPDCSCASQTALGDGFLPPDFLLWPRAA